MSEPRYRLYKNPDLVGDPLAERKGNPVRGLQKFTRAELMESNVPQEDLDGLVNVLEYVETTIGVNGVEFALASGRRYYLEQLMDSDNFYVESNLVDFS